MVCKGAFEQLKARVTSSPVLSHFNPACATFVTVDASGIALGMVLSQLQNGKEKPTAFTSRALTDTEKAYSVSEREALACIWACERWHFYLYAKKITLWTGRSDLCTLFAGSGLTGKNRCDC